MDLGFAPLFLSGFRRAVLRVDRAQSTAGKRLRGYHRLRTCLPLRRIRHVVRASDRSRFMTFDRLLDCQKLRTPPRIGNAAASYERRLFFTEADGECHVERIR